MSSSTRSWATITLPGDGIDVWFSEGLAEAMVGGTSGGAVTDLDRLDDLTSEYGPISPVSIKRYSQIVGLDGYFFHYPMFQLAVEYLIDEKSGGSPRAAIEVLIDVDNGVPFEAAFEDRMGIRLDDFENEFFNRMSGYLPQYRNPAFAPAGFALVCAVVIFFVIGPLALGHRRWRLDPVSAPLESPAGGLAGRTAFYVEITAASVAVLTFFLGLLYSIGTDDAFNNAMNTSARTRGMWILAGYLLASLSLLLWALHRWIHHSRSAFLIAPLIIATTGIAAFIIANATI